MPVAMSGSAIEVFANCSGVPSGPTPKVPAGSSGKTMHMRARKATMIIMMMNFEVPVSPRSPEASADSWSMVLPPVSLTKTSVQMKPRANGMQSVRTTVDHAGMVAASSLPAAVAAATASGLDRAGLAIVKTVAKAPRTMEEPEPPKRANAWHHATPVLRIAVG